MGRYQQGIWIAVAWLAVVGSGFAWLGVYKGTPGTAAASSALWPVGSSLPFDAERHTVLMFAHPHCPCTRSSLDELAVVLDRIGTAANVVVVFYEPANAGDSWTETDIRRRALGLKNAIVCSDVDGTEARRFGATTSGHTFVYSPDGQLLFNGGITGAQGHIGANAGRDAVVSCLANKPSQRCAPVFGCPILAK